MNIYKPKSCCGFISLKLGVLIFLILSFIVDIASIFIPIYLDVSVTLRIIYIVISLIGMIFVDIGVVGIYVHKSSCIRVYIYYFIIQWLINIIAIIASPKINSIITILVIIIESAIAFYFIIIFNTYADQLQIEEEEEEKLEEKEIAVATNV